VSQCVKISTFFFFFFFVVLKYVFFIIDISSFPYGNAVRISSNPFGKSLIPLCCIVLDRDNHTTAYWWFAVFKSAYVSMFNNKVSKLLKSQSALRFERFGFALAKIFWLKALGTIPSYRCFAKHFSRARYFWFH
jgi:hypothetical protein